MVPIPPAVPVTGVASRVLKARMAAALLRGRAGEGGGVGGRGGGVGGGVGGKGGGDSGGGGG